jgi:hypothetical protein
MVSTSGTVSSTVIQVVDILEDAMRACGLSTAEMTPDNWLTAKNNLYFYLSSLANDGIQLWTLQKYIVGMIPGQSTYELDAGAVDVMNACYRTIGHPSDGTASSSSGGPADNAFDGDINTFCIQTVANGNISYNFGDGVTYTPVMFGILANGTNTYNLVYEYSDDAITWTTHYAPGSATYTDLVWTLNDVDISSAHQYWRVRETGGATLNVREVMFGSNPYDISISRLSNDVYANLPNKFQTGVYPLQYWVDRQVDGPLLHVWPVPSDPLVQLVTYRRRHIQDVGLLTNTLEIPQRWNDAIVKGLNERLIMRLDFPSEKRQEIFIRQPILKQEALEAWTRASMEERDDTSIDIMPIMQAYTG